MKKILKLLSFVMISVLIVTVVIRNNARAENNTGSGESEVINIGVNGVIELKYNLPSHIINTYRGVGDNNGYTTTGDNCLNLESCIEHRDTSNRIDYITYKFKVVNPGSETINFAFIVDEVSETKYKPIVVNATSDGSADLVTKELDGEAVTLTDEDKYKGFKHVEISKGINVEFKCEFPASEIPGGVSGYEGTVEKIVGDFDAVSFVGASDGATEQALNKTEDNITYASFTCHGENVGTITVLANFSKIKTTVDGAEKNLAGKTDKIVITVKENPDPVDGVMTVPVTLVESNNQGSGSGNSGNNENGGNNNGNNNNEENTNDLSILPKGDVLLEVGKTVKLSANKSVRWSTGDTAIATIDQEGNVTGVAVGTTKYTAITTDGKYVTSAIVVRPAGPKLTPGGDITMGVGSSVQVTSDKTVKWSTGDKSIATIDENGKVTAVGIGTTKITAIAQDGSYSTIAIVVKEAGTATTVTEDTSASNSGSSSASESGSSTGSTSSTVAGTKIPSTGEYSMIAIFVVAAVVATFVIRKKIK